MISILAHRTNKNFLYYFHLYQKGQSKLKYEFWLQIPVNFESLISNLKMYLKDQADQMILICKWRSMLLIADFDQKLVNKDLNYW